jgi:hypothetical protein
MIADEFTQSDSNHSVELKTPSNYRKNSPEECDSSGSVPAFQVLTSSHPVH